jgi:signal transduction histidine kinase
LATRSEVAVPVKVEGGVVAIINVESPEVGTFTVDDQRLLEIIAEYLGSAFARIKEREVREGYRDRLEALNTLILRLDSAQTVDETVEVAAVLMGRLFNVDAYSIGLVKDDNLVLRSGVSGDTLTLPLSGRGLTIKAVATGETFHVKDTRGDPDHVRGIMDSLSELVVPLRVGGSVVGVLDLESVRLCAFSSEDVKLAEALAGHISAALERIGLVERQGQLREKALMEAAAAERARELASVKTRFLSSATHEIRTPLASINGYTELIQDALRVGDASKLAPYFDAVKRNAERLTRLTDELLDVQRIEDGRMVLRRAPVSTGVVLRDLVEEVSPLVAKAGQVLEVSNGFEAELYVDLDRLLQVLVNLVRNASKFSPSGSVVGVSVEGLGGEVVFSVRDRGVGLSPEDMPKLFRAFPGIHVEGNREGTGLGLSICRGIVELHGGRIWAESDGKGLGSDFRFTIPVVGG